MWPEQRVIETSQIDGNDDEHHDKTTSTDEHSAIPHVIVVPEQPKLSELERKKIRDAHSEYHDRYGYV